MSEVVDFWEFKTSLDGFELKIDVGQSNTYTTFTIPSGTSFPSKWINSLHDDIHSDIGPGFGLFPYWDGKRADRYVMIYGDQDFAVECDPEGQEMFGFPANSLHNAQDGSMRYTTPDNSIYGQFAAPVDHFIECKPKPFRIQSQASPYTGPPVIVPRGEYTLVSVLYKFVPSNMIFEDRLNRASLTVKGPGMHANNNNFQLEHLWDELRQGTDGAEVRVAPRAKSRVNSGASAWPTISDLLTSDVTPYPPDYTDDVIEDVYIRGQDYFSSMDNLLDSTQDQTGYESYNIEFEVCSDGTT